MRYIAIKICWYSNANLAYKYGYMNELVFCKPFVIRCLLCKVRVLSFGGGVNYSPCFLQKSFVFQ